MSFLPTSKKDPIFFYVCFTLTLINRFEFFIFLLERIYFQIYLMESFIKIGSVVLFLNQNNWFVMCESNFCTYVIIFYLEYLVRQKKPKARHFVDNANVKLPAKLSNMADVIKTQYSRITFFTSYRRKCQHVFLQWGTYGLYGVFHLVCGGWLDRGERVILVEYLTRKVNNNITLITNMDGLLRITLSRKEFVWR